MRAALIESPGSPAVSGERPEPTRGEGEVLVAVSAAPIVPLDRLCASGTSYFGVPSTPYVPGVQGVGLVLEGPAGLAKGTPVWFATTAGMQPGDGSMRDGRRGPRVRRRRARAGRGPGPGRRARALGGGGLDGADLPRRPGGGRAGAGAGRRGRGRAGRRPARPVRGRRADRRRGPRGAVPGAGPRAGRGRRGAARRHRRRGPAGRPDARRRPGRPGRRPAVRRPGRRGTARAAPARAPGQPGQLGSGDGADRLVDPAQPLAARARLHEQRADPRAARRARWPTSSTRCSPAGSPSPTSPCRWSTSPACGTAPATGSSSFPEEAARRCRFSRRRWSAATPSPSG